MRSQRALAKPLWCGSPPERPSIGETFPGPSVRRVFPSSFRDAPCRAQFVAVVSQKVSGLKEEV